MQHLLKNLHWNLFYAMMGLAAMGLIFIHSASHYETGQFAMKQLFWMGVGLLAFFSIAILGYRTFLGMSYLLYVIAIGLLLWVLVLGEAHLGAQRWFRIGPVAFQPSEFAKLATVLALANFLGSNHQWEKEGRFILSALGIALLPFFLIVKQPDLGTALLFLPMVVVLLFLWGMRYRYVIGSALMVAVATPFLWQFLKEYQKKRILVFLNPNLDPLGAGYTALQSRIAIGSGGLFGRGYLNGTQSQLDFVPEHHTDFIFCVIGEEWGFAGSILLLFLYGWLFKACFEVLEHTTDVKAKLLVAGLMSLMFCQVFINIGMSFGLMPITGLTLPLVSYGGSSFFATAIALGLIVSVYKERSIF